MEQYHSHKSVATKGLIFSDLFHFSFSFISFPDSINLSMGQLIRAPGSYEELLDNIQSEKHFLFNFNLSNLPQLFFLIINDIIYFETNKTCFIIKMKIKFSHPLTLQAYLVLVQWIWLKKRHSKTLRNQTWSSWRRSTCCSRWRRRWLKDASFNKSRNSKNRQDDAQNVPYLVHGHLWLDIWVMEVKFIAIKVSYKHLFNTNILHNT